MFLESPLRTRLNDAEVEGKPVKDGETDTFSVRRNLEWSRDIATFCAWIYEPLKSALQNYARVSTEPMREREKEIVRYKCFA